MRTFFAFGYKSVVIQVVFSSAFVTLYPAAVVVPRQGILIQTVLLYAVWTLCVERVQTASQRTVSHYYPVVTAQDARLSYLSLGGNHFLFGGLAVVQFRHYAAQTVLRYRRYPGIDAPRCRVYGIVNDARVVNIQVVYKETLVFGCIFRIIGTRCRKQQE